jgi:hypothetical protein
VTGEVISFVRKWGEQAIRRQQYAATLALIFAFLSFFDMPLIGWLSSVLIALVTLQNGARQGLMVIIWAILPGVAMLCLGQYAVFLDILCLQFLLSWGFALILRQYGSWMVLMQSSAGLGVLGVMIIHFFFPGVQASLVSQLSAIAKDYHSMTMFKIQPSDIDYWFNYFSLFATSMLAIKVLTSNLLVVLLARWWQSSVIPTINLQKEFYQMRLHYFAAIVLIVLTFGVRYDSTLFFNILVVAVMPFVFCGLSVLHTLCATKKNGSVFLSVFYVLFVFLSPYILACLTVLGWLDCFLDFRKKFIVEEAVKE